MLPRMLSDAEPKDTESEWILSVYGGVFLSVICYSLWKACYKTNKIGSLVVVIIFALFRLLLAFAPLYIGIIPYIYYYPVSVLEIIRFIPYLLYVFVPVLNLIWSIRFLIYKISQRKLMRGEEQKYE